MTTKAKDASPNGTGKKVGSTVDRPDAENRVAEHVAKMEATAQKKSAAIVLPEIMVRLSYQVVNTRSHNFRFSNLHLDTKSLVS